MIHIDDGTGQQVSAADTLELLLNLYFVVIGPSLANKINVDNSSSLKSFTCDSPYKMHDWKPVDRAEKLLLFDGIDLGKKSNIEYLQTRFLKDCFNIVPEPAISLFNLVVENCMCYTPTYIGGSKSLLKNYWPISLIHLMGKLL